MTSLYIHLPFCKKKCNYCDFVSSAGKENLIDEYVAALCGEISTPSSFLPLNKGENVERSETSGGTLFFGGGTPTILSPKHFNKIINSIICHLSFDICHSEISVEANPGTADLAKLKALRQLGPNRLSIGVQSFNDRHLKALGRIHTAKEAIKFYDNARSAGFENVNLDLMFALPGQTLGEWKANLDFAVSLQPDHLSTYNLQIEEGTPLFEATSNFKHPTSKPTSHLSLPHFQLPSEEEELSMYEYTIETLAAAGYKHYEISNFAKPGRECLHNINYWKNGNYLGLGAGAHSHVDGKRWSNPDSIEEYIKTPSSFLPLNKGENVERSETRGGETIFLGLRLLDGLETEKFAGFEKETARLIDDGLLELKDSCYRLTRRGLFLGNLVFEKFV